MGPNMHDPLSVLDGRPAMKLLDEYRAVRARAPHAGRAAFAAEDQGVQSMPDASPTKWHLAHTSWFFETFVLQPHAREQPAVDPAYRFLFNFVLRGDRQPRPNRARRGTLSRPGLDEVQAYRHHVDQAIGRLLEVKVADPAFASSTMVLGLHHEEMRRIVKLKRRPVG